MLDYIQYMCRCSKNGKLQKRGKMNLIGRLQLSTERSKEEDNDGIVQLRILRVQVSYVIALGINYIIYEYLIFSHHCTNMYFFS